MDVLLREAPHRFPGGLALPAMKDDSTSQRIAHPDLPSQLILPLKQHIGSDAIPLVKIGERVLKGQCIAAKEGSLSANIHAPTSGTVISIGLHPIAHPSAHAAQCIRIIPDGEDQWLDRPVTKRNWQILTPEEMVLIIEAAGIVGLGGATFPSDIKLKGLDEGCELKTLIINAAECEPYISCDDMLMREYAEDIIRGTQILMQATRAQRCMFAIEDNKPEAIRMMRNTLGELGDYRIELYTLNSVYPQGGEKQLIQSLTGQEVPVGEHPSSLGLLMFNVATTKAIYEAIVEDRPLLSRVVTVTGHGVAKPRNIEALLGTPAGELIEYCGGYTDTDKKTGTQEPKLIMGGPLMGVSLPNDSVPVVKAMNCLLVANKQDKVSATKQAKPCIRCGECATVCPAKLLPQQLYWYSKAQDYVETERFNVFDCIECGACDYVCPSHIPLVNYFRHAKGEIRHRNEQKQSSDIARERFILREQRLERLAAERKAKLDAKKKRIEQSKLDNKSTSHGSDKKDAIAEIMQRAQQKQSGDV